MRFKVELGFIDSSDEERDVFFSTFVEAGSEDEAVETAKQEQVKLRPDLSPTNRWFWFAFETNENA